MGEREHVTAVGGESGEPVSTTEDGSIQTDNYPQGGAFGTDGTYPVTIDATEEGVDAVQEVMITEAGDVTMEVQTVQGSIFDVALESTVGRWEIWEIETVTFRDPDGTGAALYGAWGGE